MTDIHPLLRRSPDFQKTGRVTWIEKTADALGLNRVFLRRPEIQVNAEPNVVVSPAQAKIETLAPISESGVIEEKKALGGKRSFTLSEVLKDDAEAEAFCGGQYVKMYLAPWDLHFLVFPAKATATAYEYRAGWAVPLAFMRTGDVLNERLCVRLDTEWGFPILFVMIGSWFVNGIHHAFREGESYEKGDEIGYFKLGSSVVMAFPPDTIEWSCKKGEKLGLGAPLARRI